MINSQKTTLQDDCLILLHVLADAPTGGLSMKEIQDIVTNAGSNWSLTKVNDILCSIRAQTTFQKVRVKSGRKETKYTLKPQRSA